MMKRLSLALAAVGLLLFAVPLQAQGIFVGGGVTIPTGEFGDFADTGWLATGGFWFDLGDSGVAAGVEGFYGQNDHDTEGEKTNPYGAMGFLLYRVGSPERVGPYGFGGAGVIVHDFSSATESSSDTNFGYEFGAGLDFPFTTRVGAWLEARFMGSSETNFFGILAGLGFNLGN